MTNSPEEPLQWVEGIDSAPHATTVLAGYFDQEVGEWVVDLFVAKRPEAPYTHWLFVNRPGEHSPEEHVQVTGHTPTPWAIRQSGDDWEIYPLRDGPPKIGAWAEVATCHDQYDDHDEARKNAELILAAVHAYVNAPSDLLCVTPLVWRTLDNGTAWSNLTPVSLAYHVTEYGWCHRNGNLNPTDGIEAAKAAAQADYEARVLSCLATEGKSDV